jgi:aminopeptidase N
MIGDTTLRAELFVDPHSFSTPEATVTHLEWDASVDFDAQEIHATAVWTLSETHGDRVVFDTKALQIESVLLDGQEAQWGFEEEDDLLGSALVVYDLSPASKEVSITYVTTEGAEAVQWFPAALTQGKRMPFLFTQSQAILARTWIPLSRPSWSAFYLQCERASSGGDVSTDECLQPNTEIGQW